jgi:alanine dehydrogenase
MLILSQHEVRALLNLDQLIEALAPAMVELSSGAVSMPPRVAAMVLEHEGLLGVMPVYVGSSSTLAAKLVSVYPNNSGLGVPTHQALVAVFNPATGTPLAIMDGTYLTAARTAAGSALATRLLARPDADVLVIVGTGTQARAHAQVIPRVRTVREVRIVGRNEQRADELAAELAKEFAIFVRSCASFSDAATGAGIVCAATNSCEPVVLGQCLEPGVHVNSVGLNPQGREVNDAAILKSLVVVESRQAALAPGPGGATDLTRPVREGLITEGHIHAEVGEIISGMRPGRTSSQQITLYKSVGVAVQDAVAAQLVLIAAWEQGVGLEVEL